MIALIDSKVAYHTLHAPLDSLAQQPDLVKNRLQLTQSRHGKVTIAGEEWVYGVEPIQMGGEVQGVLVLLYDTATTIREVNDSMSIVVQVAMIVFIVATVIAWRTAGRVSTLYIASE